MDIIKKLFCFNDDESSAIGLCKFSDDFFKLQVSKENFKKRIQKDANITKMLRRTI